MTDRYKNEHAERPTFFPDQNVSKLNERSKDDRAIIVGSEVRMLCGKIDAQAARIASLEAALQQAADLIAEQLVPLDFVTVKECLELGDAHNKKCADLLPVLRDALAKAGGA